MMKQALPALLLLFIYSVTMFEIVYDKHHLWNKKDQGPSWLNITVITIIAFGLAYAMFYLLSLTVAWLVCLPFLAWFYFIYKLTGFSFLR